MRYLMTGRRMKEIDDYAISQIGIPSMVLMERAALTVAEAVEQQFKVSNWGKKEKRIIALCGMGNNGADGAAVARMLHLKGYQTMVLTVGKDTSRTDEMEKQLRIDENLGISVKKDLKILGSMEEKGCVLIDALFGIGLSREMTGEYKEAVLTAERVQPAFTVAVDIPSGIHADTGQIMGTAIKADLTITFGFEKLGTVLYPGKSYAGRVSVADIGFPEYADKDGHRFFTLERNDLSLIPKRKPEAHKGIYKKVLIAAGSKGMCGAAYLSALAAYRTGAGLVKIMTLEENAGILQTLLPEAVLSLYSSDMEEQAPEQFEKFVKKECNWADVIVLGPGLGKERYAVKLTEYMLMSAAVPLILDADGLNAVAEHPHLTSYFTKNVIITPHLGEMSRLTGKSTEAIKEDLTAAAAGYALKYGITCVLKDAAAVVAQKNGSIYINTSGSAGMAKAGSGDVLTGIIAGLIALSLEGETAAVMGVYLHGLAGSRAGKKTGEHSLLAREIADAVMGEDDNGITI